MDKMNGTKFSRDYISKRKLKKNDYIWISSYALCFGMQTSRMLRATVFSVKALMTMVVVNGKEWRIQWNKWQVIWDNKAALHMLNPLIFNI